MTRAHPHVRSRCIEGHVVDKEKPVHNPCGAVVPLIMAHATLLLGRLQLFEQIGMVAFFHPEDVVTTGIVQGFDVEWGCETLRGI